MLSRIIRVPLLATVIALGAMTSPATTVRKVSRYPNATGALLLAFALGAVGSLSAVGDSRFSVASPRVYIPILVVALSCFAAGALFGARAVRAEAWQSQAEDM
jgi:hypothetical protein